MAFIVDLWKFYLRTLSQTNSLTSNTTWMGEIQDNDETYDLDIVEEL